jgi:HD-GYP domain-containing protein (c-di-GMP phosphodiesterase class II)
MSTATSTVNGVSAAEATGYLPIAVGTLAPAEHLNFDLFLRSDSGQSTLFRGKNYELEHADLKRLAESSISTLFIRVADHERYCEYLRDDVLASGDLQPEQRLQVLTAVNRSVFESAFSSVNMQRYMEFADNVGRELAETMASIDISLSGLLKLLTHDYYTYTHVANVTTYCLALARGLGMNDVTVLKEMATGALLHDYGKRHIPKYVLNCTSKLDDAAWQMMLMHPTHGFRDLCVREDVTWAQVMMAYQHHERPDGKGYPVGIGGEEIHLWARICKIADVFDALTSERPYRKPDPISRVFEMLESRAGTEFDGELVQCFQAMFHCSN